MASDSRETWIDWTRGIAACAVAIFHFNEVRPGTGWYGEFASYGWLGVPAFFVLSGYCIRAASLRSSSWRHFLFARACRIYPPYIFSLIVVISIVGWRVLTTGTNDIIVLPQTWPSISLTLALLVSPATDVPGINWVYWTLTYEAAFYVIMAVAMSARGASVALLLVIGLASLVTPLHGLPGLYFLNHWGLFALGAALVDLRNNKLHRIFGVALAIVAAASVGVSEKLPSQLASATVAALAIVFNLPKLRSLQINMKPLRMLGDISYSLYLLHVPIGVFFLGRLVHLDREVSIVRAMFTDIALLTACIAAATLGYLCVERPSIAWGRSAFRSFANTPVVSAAQQI